MIFRNRSWQKMKGKYLVLLESIIGKSESSHQHDGGNGSVQFCEFSEKTLFRRFQLDHAIEVDRVSTRVDNGISGLSRPNRDRLSGRHLFPTRRDSHPLRRHMFYSGRAQRLSESNGVFAGSK
jgi:hypothetical protein